MPKLLVIFSLCFFNVVSAQSFKISGKVTNVAGEPVAFASVQVKELQSGTVTKEDGTYILLLEEGKYDLVVSIIGYKTQVLTLVITKNYIQNIILDDDRGVMNNVVIKSKYRDPATELVRQVIHRKDSLVAATGAWSAKLYIKASQQQSGQKEKHTKDTSKTDRGMNGMAIAEILVQLDYASDQKIKEERLGVKRWGSIEDLFYLTATEGSFNYYRNPVKVPGLSPTPFVSPVSFSGLLAYRFKTTNIENVGKYKRYTISVKPRQMSNATVEGEFTLNDSSYTIEHTRFSFPKYHLPQYDFFEAEQWYQSGSPLLTRQQFSYHSKTGQRKLSGNTIISYSDYEVNKPFPKNHFGVEVSATSEQAYKRDSTFWDSARTEPLTVKEVLFIRYKDSLYRVTHTKEYLDSIDHVTNKFTWKKLLLTGQTLYNRKLERTWSLPSLPAFYQPFAFGGSRINPGVSFMKTYPSRKNIAIYSDVSYGLRNNDINGSIRLNRMYNPFNRGFYSISLQRDFDFIFQGDAWINMLKRSNQYLNNAFGLYHGLELTNGLFLYTDMEISFRKSLQNYKIGGTIDTLFGEVLENNQAVAFESYNAMYGRLKLEYTPFQRFIREPKEKVILGSKWPTFFTIWSKGIPGVFGSKVDFLYWDLGLRQEISFGLAGILRYKFNSGTFLTRRDLRIVDYQFQRRGDPLLFANPDGAFQALDSSFPFFKRFYQAHLVHEFNGYFINRIPLLKKLGLREVAGGGFLYAPERNLRYAETFVGVERAFRWPFNLGSKFKLGVYVVGSVANKFTNPLTFKIGVTSWDKRRNKWY